MSAGVASTLTATAAAVLASLAVHEIFFSAESTEQQQITIAQRSSGLQERLGFRASKWGPHIWRTLHIMALNLPRNYSSAARDFEQYLVQLAKVLPCATCRKEFTSLQRTVPPHQFMVLGRAGAVGLIYVYHTLVTRRTQPGVKDTPFLQEEQMLLHEYASEMKKDSPEVFLQKLQQDVQDKGVDALMQEYLD